MKPITYFPELYNNKLRHDYFKQSPLRNTLNPIFINLSQNKIKNYLYIAS